ncbi:Ig-like domain-containing protein [Gelidibacter gilvus]|uniref:T9SS type A sorting domain-containing protein n=1 Tax=Gelidibacter gilvus TaxID=59602 RepID=A0A4Q0XGP8_9FLAO|nr:Ig-like domain-containing protein [Gelidibacter gilvus]RXJ45969.1 T9SS type A sorting domain-containing protein [Gelidibacter gilvus]
MKSLHLFCSFFIIFACQLFFSKSYAQNYPSNQNIHDIQWESYKQPKNTPNYLSPFTDPVTGNKVTRISDEDVFGCDCETLRHNYSKNQPWNADGSLIKTDGSHAKILDGNTYEVLRTANPKSLWSNIDPKVTFETAQNKFYKNNIDTNKETVLRIFSEYETISIGYGEGNLSNDDRWIAFIGVNGNNQTVLVYDILNDAIVGSKFIGTASVDWVSVSQSGQFVVILYHNRGGGEYQGAKSYNRQMKNEVHLINSSEHADLGYDMAGNEVYVSVGRYEGHSLSYTRLDNGFTKGLWKSAWKPGDRGIAGAHASTRNLKRPGWAYISTDQQAHDPLVYDAPKEIFAIRLDNSETIERFGKHHTKFDGSKSPYNHETHPVPNRDGTKVIFASNWHNSQWMRNNYPMMWVVETAQNSNNIAVKSLKISPESANLSMKKTLQLTVAFEPKNVTNKNGIWRSNNNNVATVDANGVVTPISVGKVDIIFKSADGGIEEEAELTVISEVSKVVANGGGDQSVVLGVGTYLRASGGASYLWNTGATSQNLWINPTTSRNYTVTVFDSTGNYSDTDEVNVTVLPVSAGNDITIKTGESIVLEASNAYDYEWSTGEKTARATISPEETTTYRVWGNTNGYESSDTVTVTVEESGVSSSTKVVANGGGDQSVVLGVGTYLRASGGASYLWNTGSTSQNLWINPTTSRKYSVTVFDSTGNYSDTDEVFVTIVPVSAGNDVTIKAGESIVLEASNAYGYEWSTGASTATVTVSPEETTTYRVWGNTNGYESSDTVRVTVDESVVTSSTKVVANGGGDQSVVLGVGTYLRASGGASYLWNTGATSQNLWINPTTSRKYTVTVFDNSGENSDTDEVYVTIVPVSAGNNVTIKSGESVILGASNAYNFEWNTGENTASIMVSPKKTTIYHVKGDTHGYESYDTVTVTVLSDQIASSRGGGGPIVMSNVNSDNEIFNMSHEKLDPEIGSFLVYPNPTEGELNVKFKGISELMKMNLYDLSGKSLFSEDINFNGQLNYTKILNLSNFEPGVYLLQIIDNNEIISKKILLR